MILNDSVPWKQNLAVDMLAPSSWLYHLSTVGL